MNEAITSDVHALVVEFDQESSITDVKNTLAGELRSVGRSSCSWKCCDRCDGEERAGDAKHREIDFLRTSSGCTVRRLALVSAISTWTLEVVGLVVSRSQSSVPNVRTACERRKRAAAKRWSGSMSW